MGEVLVVKGIKIDTRTEIALGEAFGILDRMHNILLETCCNVKNNRLELAQPQITALHEMLDQVEITLTEILKK